MWRANVIQLTIAAATLAPSPVCAAPPSWPPPREVDVRRAAAAGVRVVDGPRLRLFTDLPPGAAVDELPAVFAAAVPQWARYFGIDETKLERWQMQGYLIDDRAKFAALGLLPENNRDFANGYAEGYELWLVEQPSDYYRRHLLLHEGTHALMLTQLGNCGPGWYMEGTAELLGTHSWQDGKLTLGVVPPSRKAVPMWGRVKLVRDAFAAGRAKSLVGVLAIDNRRQLDTSHYAWTWAFAALLEHDERFRLRFRALQKYVNEDDFTQRFREAFANDWADLQNQWQVTVAALDYGYDFQRMAIVEREAEPVGRTATVEIAADRGWQSTGWRLDAGKSYQITAAGRYQIAEENGKPWPCEPGGVTIEYHDGRPLGVLLGAFRTDVPVVRDEKRRDPSFATPLVVGLGQTVHLSRDAVLYLRVNDSAARLDDNRGSVQVVVRVD